MQKSMQLDQLDLSQQNQDHKLARRFILAQLLATMLLSAALFAYDYTAAYSALTGGLIATLANALFALKVFRVKSEATPEVLLTAFYVGEISKFILTGTMFVIVFVLIKPLNVVALLGMYLLIHMTPAMVNVFNRDGHVYGQINNNAGNVRDKES
jgi:ATP synthase protein I